MHEFWRKDADSGELGDPRRPDRFSTTLPQSPLSYESQIVKIRWCVRVRVIFSRRPRPCGPKVVPAGKCPTSGGQKGRS